MQYGEKHGKDDGDGVLPSLIISADEYNAIGSKRVIVLPIVPHNKFNNSTLISLDANGHLSGPGLTEDPHAACDEIRAVGVDRLIKKYGGVSVATLDRVSGALGRLLCIKPKPRSGGWGGGSGPLN